MKPLIKGILWSIPIALIMWAILVTIAAIAYSQEEATPPRVYEPVPEKALLPPKPKLKPTENQIPPKKFTIPMPIPGPEPTPDPICPDDSKLAEWEYKAAAHDLYMEQMKIEQYVRQLKSQLLNQKSYLDLQRKVQELKIKYEKFKLEEPE